MIRTIKRRDGSGDIYEFLGESGKVYLSINDAWCGQICCGGQLHGYTVRYYERAGEHFDAVINRWMRRWRAGEQMI
jgi:hypothetical protein